MMQRVMYTGSDAILTAFDFMSEETPYYSVWIGKSIMASHNTDDLDKGRKKIEQMIIACEQSGNTDMITIKFHPNPDKAGFITDKTPVCSSMTVRSSSIEGNLDQLERLTNTQYDYMLKSITQSIDSKILPMQQKLLELESSPGEDDEGGLIGAINKFSPLLQNPVIAGLIERILTPILGGGSAQPRPVMISGTPAGVSSSDQEQQVLNEQAMNKLNDALNRLANHCDLVGDLSKLADVAENNPGMFKMLLTSLRSQ